VSSVDRRVLNEMYSLWVGGQQGGNTKLKKKANHERARGTKKRLDPQCTNERFLKLSSLEKGVMLGNKVLGYDGEVKNWKI